jgi:hypothetical protein
MFLDNECGSGSPSYLNIAVSAIQFSGKSTQTMEKDCHFQESLQLYQQLANAVIENLLMP